MRTIALLIAFLATLSFGAEVPMPAADRDPPPGLEGLVWNKWDTPNFIVISLDKGQGSSMRGEAESVRSSLIERWSLASPKRECKIVCVPDAVMLKRLFGLSDPRCEVSRSESGDFRAAIWIDIPRIDMLPSLVAEAELSSGDHAPFVARGVPILELPAAKARGVLLNSPAVPLASVLAATDKADAAAVAGNSAFLCLLVRREFGSAAFARVAPSPAPWRVLGFSSEEDFSANFSRYRTNLAADLKSGRTPDVYITARP